MSIPYADRTRMSRLRVATGNPQPAAPGYWRSIQIQCTIGVVVTIGHFTALRRIQQREKAEAIRNAA